MTKQSEEGWFQICMWRSLRCCGVEGIPDWVFVCVGFDWLAFVCFSFKISLIEKYIEEKLLDRIPGFNMTAFTMSLQWVFCFAFVEGEGGLCVSQSFYLDLNSGVHSSPLRKKLPLKDHNSSRSALPLWIPAVLAEIWLRIICCIDCW